MNAMHNLRVAIVDDHAIVRQGLRNLLTKRDFVVVGEAACGDEAVTLARECLPDVMLLDIRMKECDGLTALPDIKRASPQTKVIILTTYANPTYFSEAIKKGASGYLLKDAEPDEIVQAIQTAASQHHLFDPALLSQVVNMSDTTETPQVQDTSPPPSTNGNGYSNSYSNSETLQLADPISERENDVLQLMAQGMSNANIAENLQVSIATVKTHVAHILQKLNANDRTQAVVIAMRHNLVR
jgi:DNA-binding NarL/FixJ family response regulator